MSHLFSRDTAIGIVGAGAMGAGIAQVAASAGHRVIVGDLSRDALTQAQARLEQVLERDVEKGRKSSADALGIRGRIQFSELSAGYGAFREAGLVIEAIIEDLPVKQQTFSALEGVLSPEAVLGTNTSSLSVTALAAVCQRPEQVLGVHFFNPAPLMPLVEVVRGDATPAALVDAVVALVTSWGKSCVIAEDTPGFIVNRIARPYYGEALRMLEEHLADVPTIDWALREIGGFRMGPFELMDMIGNDVNYAVTCSIFAAFYYEPRYRPSLTQKRLVDGRRLGRKSGRGYYDYKDGGSRPEATKDLALGRTLSDRIVALLINEAVDALQLRIASRDHIDLAMTQGVNYPRGLLRWADEIGLAVVLERLTALQNEYGEDRYRPSPLLRRMVREGRRFYS